MKRQEATIGRIPDALSVDVEDWFNATMLQLTGRLIGPSAVVSRQSEVLLDLFEELGIRATWFFLGEVAERYPRLVKRIVDRGHEPGVHGYHHHQVSALGIDRFRLELRRAKNTIEQAGGMGVFGFRAVDFSISSNDREVMQILLEQGFKYDSSLFPFSGTRYGSSRVPLAPHWVSLSGGRLLEIPVAVARFGTMRVPCGGGGYLRQFPLFLTRRLLRQVRSDGRPVVLYLHPVEIDAHYALPALPAKLGYKETALVLRAHLLQSYSRHRTGSKISSLSKIFRFGPLTGIHEAMVSSEAIGRDMGDGGRQQGQPQS